MRSWRHAFLLLAALLALPPPGPAGAAEPFYKGKRLVILINFAAGGPTDIEGRLLGRFLGRESTTARWAVEDCSRNSLIRSCSHVLARFVAWYLASSWSTMYASAIALAICAARSGLRERKLISMM